MHLEHEFVVPVPVKQAWDVLLDVERIAPCMPGATIDAVEGDSFDGRVKVKVGPVTVTYKGTARFVQRDEDARRVTIRADGRESRGSGTAAATIDAALYDEGERTRVTVHTELAITGRPAQFGRGVMVEVSNKLLGQFTDCLEQTLGALPTERATDTPEAAAPSGASTVGASSAPATGAPATSAARFDGERPTPEAIDLLGAAGAPVLKRVVPAVVAMALLVLLWRVLRGRR